MMTNNKDSNQNQPLQVSLFTRFFWWCSGATISILSKHPTEKNKYVGMGAAIFFTWMLATLSGIFAFSIIFKGEQLLPIIVGILYGLMIFNLDRFITTSMKKKGNAIDVYLPFEKFQNFFLHEFLPAIPRLLIALIIGLVMAKPLELVLFKAEVQKQLELDYQVQLRQYTQKVKANTIEKKKELKTAIAEIEDKLLLAQQDIDDKTYTLYAEIEGRISGIEGDGYRAKEFRSLLREARRERTEMYEELKTKKEELSALDNKQAESINKFKREYKTEIGLFDRIKALSNLTRPPKNISDYSQSDKNGSLRWSNILIVSLIILIETAPVFVKLISARGPYDAELDFVNNKKMMDFDRKAKEIQFPKS